ncbi:MAG: O-antigen ligase family protein [Planctomycetaceae bacterium]
MWRDSYAEIIARALLVIAFCAMSWAMGGVHPSAKLWAARIIGLSVLFMLLSKPSLTWASRALPTAWLILAGAVAFGFCQLAVLDSGWIESVSPGTVASRSAVGVDTQTLSVAAPETRRDLSLLVLAVAAFCVASQVFQSVNSQLFLSFAVAINGAALSIWGLFQQWNCPNELLPGVPCEVNSIIFSTYVNHSSAAGFVNMCLGSAIGLLLWRYRSAYGSQTEASFSVSLRNVLRSLTPILLLLSLLTTVMIAGLVSSLSRGGCLAAVISFVVVTLFAARRQTSSAGFNAGVVASAIGIGLLIWIGFSDALASRYATTVQGDGIVQDNRLDHWSDGLRAARDFLPTGSGLGTYSSIYLLFEQNDNPHWFRHAHNQYLEALVDGGIPGLLLMLAAIGLVGYGCWYLATNREVGVHSWFGIGAMFLLVSQAVHATTDFGLYLPANMLLCAVVCGAVAGTAASTNNSRILRMPTSLGRPIVWNIALFAGCLFATNHLQAIETSSDTLRMASIESRSTRLPAMEEIAASVTKLDKVIRANPTDPQLRFRRARFLMLQYQRKAFDVLRSNDGLGRPEAELWNRASVEQIHAALQELSPKQQRTQAALLLQEPVVQRYIVEARKELLLARQLNPFRPRFHVYLAVLAPLFGEADIDHLNRAELLANTDVETSFDCGLLHLRANRTTRAIASWKRCLQFSRDHAELVLSLGGTRLDDDTLVNEVMPDDPVLLVRLAESRKKMNSESRLAHLLAERVLAMTESNTPSQEDYFRGRAASLLGNEVLAAEHYGRAVAEAPNQAEWRYRYAFALTNSGQLDKARAQLQWCLGVAPQNPKYQKLMRTVRLRSQDSEL